jgi:DNA-binding transcriptional LysR family regulator
MLKELHRMAVFAQVVERGSFSKAAAALGLGKSVVSAHVGALERRLATQLIQRSTRALSLTEEGAAFYESCRQMVAAGEAAFATVESRSVAASGSIRLTCSYNFGVTFLIAALARFREAHPEVSFDLVLEDAVSNVIEGRFDLAVRVGRLPDTGLHATEIGVCRMLLCTSREFAKSHEKVSVPQDLLKLPWISITQLPHPEKLELLNSRSAQRLSLRLHAAFKTHSGIAAREFVRCGAGMAVLPDFAVADDLRRGELVRLLPAWEEANPRPISALFPSRERLPTRVRLLIEFLRQEFTERLARPARPARLSKTPSS